MVLDAVRTELFSMDSLISITAIAVAAFLLGLGGQHETMESGFALLFATAVFPPMYYRESGAEITSLSRGVVYGAGTAGAVYIFFMFCYNLVQQLSVDGITAEAAAFVLVAGIVFASALLERQYQRETADGAGN